MLVDGGIYEFWPAGLGGRWALDLLDARATADGSRLVLSERHGGVSQRWRVTVPPEGAEDGNLYVLYSQSVPESTVAACGWRRRGAASDVQLWSDDPGKPARLFRAAAAGRFLTLESAMYPGRLLRAAAGGGVVLDAVEGEDAAAQWDAVQIDPDPPPRDGGVYELGIAGCGALWPPAAEVAVVEHAGDAQPLHCAIASPDWAQISAGLWRLDVRFAGTTHGALVQMFPRNCSRAQRWRVAHAGGGWVTLAPRCAPGTCLAVDTGAHAPRCGTEPGTPALHITARADDAEALPQANQLWRILPRAKRRGGGCTLVPQCFWKDPGAAPKVAGLLVRGGSVVQQDRGCRGGALAIVPDAAPDEGGGGGGGPARQRGLQGTTRWALHLSSMEELVEGGVYRLMSRFAKDFCAAAPHPRHESDGDRAVLSRYATAGGLTAEALAARGCGAPPRETQLWRVSFVGECVLLASLSDPRARLAARPGGTVHVTREGGGELWRVLEVQDGWVRLDAAASQSLSLDVPNQGAPAQGTPLQLWAHHAGKNQQWKFAPVQRTGAPGLVVWATYHALAPEDYTALAAAGYDVRVVRSTQEAWAVITTRREEVAALISSQLTAGIHAGFLSGLELCRRVKTLYSAYTYCPVLAFVSTHVAHAQALEVCDLYFSPALGERTATIVAAVGDLLAERKARPVVAAAARPEAALPLHSTSEASSGWGGAAAAADVVGEAPQASQRFSIRGKVGRGGFGTVYKAFDHAAGRYAAAKEIPLDGDLASQAQVEQEVHLLTALQHPCIVRILHVERHADGSGVRIYMEWMAGGSLADVLKDLGHRLHELTVVQYLKQALQGLAYLHSHRVVHRDIKPANLLVSDGVVKIADFGISIVAGSATARTAATQHAAGTPVYMSPEALAGKHSYASDVWAMACTVCCLCSGVEPWAHLQMDHSFGVMLHIHNARPPDHHPRIPDHLSSALAALLRAAFAHAPADRPSAEALRAHPALVAEDAPPGVERLADYVAEFQCEGRRGAAGGGPLHTALQSVALCTLSSAATTFSPASPR